MNRKYSLHLLNMDIDRFSLKSSFLSKEISLFLCKFCIISRISFIKSFENYLKFLLHFSI